MLASPYLAASALTVVPVNAPLTGKAMPPGSKSITNRALLLAALANGQSRITGALKSDDTSHMATAIREMGVEVDEPDATTFIVGSKGRLSEPEAPLFLFQRCGNMCFVCYQCWIGCTHFFNQGGCHFCKKDVFVAQFETMAHGTADDTPQHITTTFIGWQHTI